MKPQEKFSGFRPVMNVEAALKTVNKEAWRLYRAGRPLCVWRNSTPHNWWIGSKSCRSDILYHWPEREKPSAVFFEVGRQLPSNGEKVTYRGFFRGRDEGMSRSDTWVFDEQQYLNAVARWQAAVDCARDFNALAGAVVCNPSALSASARSLARQLKRGYRLPMTPDGAKEAEELCLMGLVYVIPEGFLLASGLLMTVTIPRESKLSLLPT